MGRRIKRGSCALDYLYRCDRGRRGRGASKTGSASAYYLWLGLRVAKTTERVRVVNTVTGRRERSVVQGLATASVFGDFAGNV